MTGSENVQPEAMERTRQRVLLAGVLVCGLLLLLGGVLLLALHGARRVDFSAFHGEPEGLRSLREIMRGALRLEPHAVVEAGLLLLVGVQLAQLVVALAGFARARDLRYVAMCVLLLALLVFGFAVGGG